MGTFSWFILGILLTSLLIFYRVGYVLSNPVPHPAISMPYEYIYVSISMVEDIVTANVTGTYTFVNFGYENVTMRYPVPPDSTINFVKIDGNSLTWQCINETYQTYIGNFRMIEWFIEPVPESFNVTVCYHHPLHLCSQHFLPIEYVFLYAMGTGRLLANWYKQTTAYVTIRLSKDIVQSDRISLLTIEQKDNRWWIIKIANFTLTSEDEIWTVTSTFQSDYLQPLKEDLLMTFIEGIPPCIDKPIQKPSGNVQLNQPVNVTVNVTDIGIGVYNVTLYYTTNNGTSWTPLPMDKISSQTYQAAIPGFSEKTHISYKIVAYDYAGNKAENNNNNQYYTYTVVPEYSFITLLVTLMLSTIFVLLLREKKTNLPKRQH